MSGFFEAVIARRARGPLLAAWVIEGASAGAKALFTRNGERWAEVCRDDAFPAACAGEIQAGPREQSGILAWEDARLFLEPLNWSRRLVVCGAGHVSVAVVRIGAMLDYEVTVIDDRAEFVDKARVAGASRAICRPFDEALDGIGGDPETAFVIMTREHAHDVECLRRILNKPRAYVGMMGSHSRTQAIRRQLSDEGFDAEAVRGVHMPIGLPIGSRTPAEIAVSVMAEVISVMNAAIPGEGFPPGMAEALAAAEGKAAPTAVLAMIVEKRGEAPRRPGTKLLMQADGRFIGTVGGGAAEAMILKAAGDMLNRGCRESRLVRITLEKGAMYCGGEITGFMLPVWAGDGGDGR